MSVGIDVIVYPVECVHHRGEETPLDDDLEETVTLYFNQTDPLVIRDGIDRITVGPDGDGHFLVDYWGYRTGYLRVTPEGARELGRSQDAPDSVDVGEIEALLTSDVSEARLQALSALRCICEVDPEAALDVVPEIEPLLDSNDEASQEAAIRCIAAIADEYPRQVTPMSEHVVAELNHETPHDTLESAVSFVASVADVEPRAVLDAVPRLATLLDSDSSYESDVLFAILRIAEANPEAVLPIVPQLLTHVEDEDSENRVASIAALGHVSKEFPNAAESAIPTLIELLDAEAYRLRANAGETVAELADEYPAKVRPAVPRVIELLDDSDEKARYNATSILARVAKAYPDDVEPATEQLIDMLEDDFSFSRSNAC